MNARKILGLAGVLAFATLFGLGASAWANGVRLYIVRTGSMSPAVRAGDLVVDLPVTTTTTLHIGDIITFHPQPETTETHRIHD
ncbi:MAG: S26 family signal peptidase, partial [Candidatus Limnocylindrales bacterium]